jgi:hypothetical protein
LQLAPPVENPRVGGSNPPPGTTLRDFQKLFELICAGNMCAHLQNRFLLSGFPAALSRVAELTA